MLVTTFELVALHIGDVTPEELGRCHKVSDLDRNEIFYQVENERGEMDEEGRIIEYEVRYSEEKGFTCACKSGQNGFRVSHPSKVCKHCRWVVAAILEERGYIADMAARDEQRRDEEEDKQPAKQPPGWYDEHNETSYYTGTRKSLAIGPNGLEEDDATYARVMNAQPYPWTEEEIKRDQERYAPRPFKIIDEG